MKIIQRFTLNFFSELELLSQDKRGFKRKKFHFKLILLLLLCGITTISGMFEMVDIKNVLKDLVEVKVVPEELSLKTILKTIHI